LAGARNAGLDEDAIISAELTEHQRAAVDVADALVTSPERIDAAFRERVRRELSDAQLVEVVLDTLAWSQQKVMVALDTHAAVDPDGPTPLDFDVAGHAVVGQGWERTV